MAAHCTFESQIGLLMAATLCTFENQIELLVAVCHLSDWSRCMNV